MDLILFSYFQRILKTWLFEGEIEAEGASEFFVQLQPSVLSKRNRSYWTQGFVLLAGRVPGFLQGFEEQILMCGKAVRFLKLCNPKVNVLLYAINIYIFYCTEYILFSMNNECD